MGAPEIIYVWRRIIGDTFRQSLANRVFWVMLAGTALVIFFCLGVSIEGGEPLRPPDDIEFCAAPAGILRWPLRAWRHAVGP